jgi:hypothetical protein
MAPPLWKDGKPSPPQAKDWSCHGSLGWTLQQALDELEAADRDEEDPSAAATGVAHDTTATSQAASDQARHSHVADSKASSMMNEREDPPADHEAPAASQKIRLTPEMRVAIFQAMAERPRQQQQTSPPNALMKGRVVYYQRHASKWRIEVDQVHFRRRVPLAKIRRRKEKPSLWQVSRESRSDGGGSSGQPSSNVSFELLAYNDIE